LIPEYRYCAWFSSALVAYLVDSEVIPAITSAEAAALVTAQTGG
jgi:hypothetical protein